MIFSLSRRVARTRLYRQRHLTTKVVNKPVVLCILDGWGYRPDIDNNGVLLADTPNFDKLWSYCGQRGQLSFLDACEKHVGLPEGQIGNSEVGHMNIGAGRVVYQDICRIDNAIEDGSLANNDQLQAHISTLKSTGGTCHLMGLVSPGGVHSHQKHISYLANTVSEAGVPVVVHVFTDGRDVPPQGAKESLPEFLSSLNSNISVGTVSGRYYAMDRDKRWERVEKAYDAISFGTKKDSNEVQQTPEKVLEVNYANKVTDEFIIPTVCGNFEGMEDGDGILMANFRADRAREILQMFTDESVIQETGVDVPSISDFCGLVSYSKKLDEKVSMIMGEKDLTKTLGEIISSNQKTQLRLAETEKYPHVTFFFNGGHEASFEGEERVLVPSPKVATYDLQPEMSANEVCDELCKGIESSKFDFIVVNFANPDMVGHTGDLEAAKKACETVDQCLGRMLKSLDTVGGAAIVTADHGNCEQMWNYDIDEPHTAHTLNKVPCLLYSKVDFKQTNLNSGALCDLAPTILELMELSQPKEMTGTSLLLK